MQKFDDNNLKYMCFSLSYFENLLYKFQSVSKSVLGFQKWTKKMSKNEKGR